MFTPEQNNHSSMVSRQPDQGNPSPKVKTSRKSGIKNTNQLNQKALLSHCGAGLFGLKVKNMLKHEDLNGFIGTEHYYRHIIGNFNYTDGIQYLAEQGKCYWLLDLIGSYQLDDKVKKIPFQLWNLKVNEDKTAVVTMQEDSDTPIIIEQKLPYTDFPLDQIKLYFIEGVLILPSEY